MKPALSAAFDAAREIAELLSKEDGGIDYDVSYKEMLDDFDIPHVFVSSETDLGAILPKTVEIKKGPEKFVVQVHVRDVRKGMQ